MKEKLSNIANLLNQYRSSHHIPGLAANIIADGEMIYAQGFGTPDLENPYAMVTPDTVFSIQSITKSFTASALVHLEETTSFSLDTPIIEYLPYFHTKNGPYNKITTKHILSHTAGFPDDIWVVTLLDKDLYEFSKTMPEYKYIFEQIPDLEHLLAKLGTREDITRYFANISLEYEPGESWKYCTDAYVIAADVLEKVSGMSWEAYISKHILGQMKLEQTYMNPTSDVVEGMTTKYYMKGIGEPMQVPTPNNIVGAPTGFIFSTVNDMGTYLMHQMNNRNKVLSVSALTNAYTDCEARKWT